MNLENIYTLFPNEGDAASFLEKILWDRTPICPYCESTQISAFKNGKRYHCNTCNSSFSVTVRTPFHKTKVDLQKWFYLIILSHNYMLTAGVREIGSEISVTKDTAAKMLNMIVRARKDNPALINKIVSSIKSKI